MRPQNSPNIPNTQRNLSKCLKRFAFQKQNYFNIYAFHEHWDDPLEEWRLVLPQSCGRDHLLHRSMCRVLSFCSPRRCWEIVLEYLLSIFSCLQIIFFAPPFQCWEIKTTHFSKVLVGKKRQSQSISHGLGQNILSIRIRGCYFIWCNYVGLLVYKWEIDAYLQDYLRASAMVSGSLWPRVSGKKMARDPATAKMKR